MIKSYNICQNTSCLFHVITHKRIYFRHFFICFFFTSFFEHLVLAMTYTTSWHMITVVDMFSFREPDGYTRPSIFHFSVSIAGIYQLTLGERIIRYAAFSSKSVRLNLRLRPSSCTTRAFRALNIFRFVMYV